MRASVAGYGIHPSVPSAHLHIGLKFLSINLKLIELLHENATHQHE